MKRRNRAYFILIATIVAITVSAQLLIQYALDQQKHNAHVINLAGRQRMLSQKLVKMVYLCRWVGCDFDELSRLNEEWNQVHLGLQNGDKTLNLPSLRSEKIRGLFSELNPYQSVIYTNIAQLKDTVGLDKTILALQVSEGEFLSQMDQIVFTFEAEAEASLNQLIFLEVLLAILSMCILICEVLFIVRPSFKHIIRQNEALKKIAWQQSHEVRKPVANIVGLSSIIKKEKLDDDNLKAVEYIQQSAKDLDKIIHEIVEDASSQTLKEK